MSAVQGLARMAAFGVMVAAERGARIIARRLGVQSDNRVEYVSGTWCVGSGDAVYYRDRDGHVSKGYRCTPHRWARWAVVSECWYDGGGTTYILRVDREVHGAAASAMERELSDWLERGP